jgi:hypothetical protein
MDKNGNPVTFRRFVFDEAYRPIVSMLQAGYKSELVGSRAIGKDRESVLDITVNLRKEALRKQEQQGKSFGLGK